MSKKSLFLLCNIILFFSIELFAGRIDRAFEALEVYNYFKAKDLFYKSLKKDLVPASYGLSIIYGRNDNPFYNLDSAYKYIVIADTNFNNLDDNDVEDVKQ